MGHRGSNIERSSYYGALQGVVDSLFDGLEVPSGGVPGKLGGADLAAPGAGAPSAADTFGVSERAASLLGLGALVADEGAEGGAPAGPTIRRLDAVLAAEAADLPDDLVRIVKLLPPGDYTRERLCTQLNSAIAGHAWGQVYGTVE